MSTETTRRPIHILNALGTHCAAEDGVALPGADNLPYVTSIGEWNQLKHRCSPSKIMRPDYVLVDRSPLATSAIQHPLPPTEKTK